MTDGTKKLLETATKTLFDLLSCDPNVHATSYDLDAHTVTANVAAIEVLIEYKYDPCRRHWVEISCPRCPSSKAYVMCGNAFDHEEVVSKISSVFGGTLWKVGWIFSHPDDLRDKKASDAHADVYLTPAEMSRSLSFGVDVLTFPYVTTGPHGDLVAVSVRDDKVAEFFRNGVDGTPMLAVAKTYVGQDGNAKKTGYEKCVAVWPMRPLGTPHPEYRAEADVLVAAAEAAGLEIRAVDVSGGRPTIRACHGDFGEYTFDRVSDHDFEFELRSEQTDMYVGVGITDADYDEAYDDGRDLETMFAERAGTRVAEALSYLESANVATIERGEHRDDRSETISWSAQEPKWSVGLDGEWKTIETYPNKKCLTQAMDVGDAFAKRYTSDGGETWREWRSVVVEK